MAKKKAAARNKARAGAGGRASGGIGDEAVRKGTGKAWKEWFAILDRARASELDHKGIVAYLAGRYDFSGWWMQMVTVRYEQERGLRELHQKPGGYQISGSRTIGVPVATLYRAWSDARARSRWLPGARLTVRKATRNRSMRITWVDGATSTTSVDANFYAKGKDKSQVSVQHSKLESRTAADRMKKHWSERLGVLKETLERSLQA